MKYQEFKDLIFECYCEVLQDRAKQQLLTEDAEKDQAMVYGEGEGDVLPDSTDQILAKFPTLKHALVRLQTENFMEFVSGIDWVSPRPTEFRINLKNGQSFGLKWMGKDFEATVSGKKYYLGQLTDFQKVLGSLSTLYKEGPMGRDDANNAPNAPGIGDTGGSTGGGGGAGDFPGGEDTMNGGEDIGSEEVPAEGEAEQGAEGESGKKDMSNQNVNFEADSDI